jgi:hypothetical protein
MARGVPDLSDAPAGLHLVGVSNKPLREGVVLDATSRPGTATVRLTDGSVISTWLTGRLLTDYFVGLDRYRFHERLVGARVWVADCGPCSGPQTQVVQMVLPAAEQRHAEPGAAADGGA